MFTDKLETISEIVKQYNRIRVEAEVKIAQAELAIARANADEMEALERAYENRKTYNHKHWRRCESECRCQSNPFED